MNKSVETSSPEEPLIPSPQESENRLMIRLTRYGLLVLAAVSALVLSGCSENVDHTRATISVASSGTTDVNGDFVPLYIVDLTVSSKEYQKLTGVKTDCTASPCKPIQGVVLSQEDFNLFTTATQRTSLACLDTASPKPVIRYQLFSAAGYGTKDSADGVWYPRQLQMSGGDTSILDPSCTIKQVSSPAPDDIPIAKG